MSELEQQLREAGVNITGGIWKTNPVDVEPDIELNRWWVFAAPSFTCPGCSTQYAKGGTCKNCVSGNPHNDVQLEATVDHHFNGYNARGQEGRVSSKIIEFDNDTKIGTTRSGRTYRLIGQPGYEGDAFYVYQRWLGINNLNEADIKDATGEYLTLEEKQDLLPDNPELWV